MAADTLKSKLKAINPDGAYRAVGRVKDAHGLKGEIWVVLFAGEADWLESLRETGGFLLASQEDVSSEAEVKSSTTEYPLKGVRSIKMGLFCKAKLLPIERLPKSFVVNFSLFPIPISKPKKAKSFISARSKDLRLSKLEKLWVRSLDFLAMLRKTS